MLVNLQALLDPAEGLNQKGKERKENVTLFSDHNGSLLRRQPKAMTIGHRGLNQMGSRRPQL